MALSNHASFDLIRYLYQGVVTSSMTASGHYIASILELTPGKTVTTIGAYCSASTSGVVDVQLETVSSNVPSGSLIATGASLLSQSVSSSTWYTFTLTTPYAVPTSASTLAAATLRYVSGTKADFNTPATVGYGLGWGGTMWTPRMVISLGSASQKNMSPTIIVGYSDGTYTHHCWPYTSTNSNVTATAINTSGSGVQDEYGNSFTPTANVNCVGISIINRSNSSPSAYLRLYDADAGTVLTTDSEMTVTSAQISSGSPYICVMPLTTPIQLIAGKRYYVTIKNTTASANNFYVYDSTFTSQAIADAACGLEGTKHVYRSGTGSWTETAAKIFCISPVCSYAYMPMRQCNTGGFCS